MNEFPCSSIFKMYTQGNNWEYPALINSRFCLLSQINVKEDEVNRTQEIFKSSSIALLNVWLQNWEFLTQRTDFWENILKIRVESSIMYCDLLKIQNNSNSEARKKPVSCINYASYQFKYSLCSTFYLGKAMSYAGKYRARFPWVWRGIHFCSPLDE